MDEKYEIVVTEEYERLVKFFVENQLEFDGDEEVDTDIIRCYKIEDNEGSLIGAAVLAKREEKYIVDGIAVHNDYRKEGLGKKLLDRLIKDTKDLGGNEIYLVARAPGFFRTQGFSNVNPDSAPNFFECKYCPQYKVSCHPEIMNILI
ncbi:MAG: GNAT family N-acetyltransferase [Firmicutes bacterium]|nr:GNAT family N-acetyltransferase [Bacillota bacterium]